MAIPKLFQIDWAHLLVPTVALGEIILRGSLVYLLIFALMRVILKREAESTALPALLMIVLRSLPCCTPFIAVVRGM